MWDWPFQSDEIIVFKITTFRVEKTPETKELCGSSKIWPEKNVSSFHHQVGVNKDSFYHQLLSTIFSRQHSIHSHQLLFCLCLFRWAKTILQRAPPWRKQRTFTMSLPSQTFALWMNYDWDPRLSIPHTMRDGSRKNLHLRRAALLTAEKPPESFVATELSRKHTRAHTETRQEFLVSPDRCLLRQQSPSFLPLLCPSQPRSGDWERNERHERRREEWGDSFQTTQPPSQDSISFVKYFKGERAEILASSQ